MSEPLVVLVNPAAGGGRCRRRVRRCLPRLTASGLELELHEPSSRGAMQRLIREGWHAGRRRFVAAGGDGTVHTAVDALLDVAGAAGPERPCLGILPLGTGNSFVRDFSARPLEHAIGALCRGETRPADVLRIRHADGETFALGSFSLAFAADVAALVNRRLKPFGVLGYSLGVLACLARLAPLRLGVGVDGEPVERLDTVLLCAQNNCYVGGNMRMAPDACSDDGEGDLVVAGPVGRLELLRTFPKIFTGTHVGHPAVALRRFHRLSLETDGPLPVMLDGESLELEPLAIEVVPHALDVLL